MKKDNKRNLTILVVALAILVVFAFYKSNTSRPNSQTSASANKNGSVLNIEQEAKQNINFRKVLYTAKSSQLVVMSLKPGEDIGLEVHQVDQFLRIEVGQGKVILNGVEHDLTDGSAIVVPAGTSHNIINTGSTEMKLYTVYSPPDHLDGIVHKTKADALKSDPPWDGKTTE